MGKITNGIEKIDMFTGTSTKELLKKAVPAGLAVGATEAIGRAVSEKIIHNDKLKAKLEKIKVKKPTFKKTKKVKAKKKPEEAKTN